FMHWHSFTVHILLAGYPILLTAAGDIRPQAKYIPRCLLLLLAMAIPIYGVNLALDTNFMFLMFAKEGNPLLIFENLWGNHLLGYPVLISAVLVVMHLPPWLLSKRKQHAAINH
ncbi:MAG: YwaF family protein, partial [Ruminiclostridium sp.]|nr:YwaF family protein [Ruminiclostridium sp.]